MITHQEVADRTGTEIPPHLIAQAEVPVATNWRQGDVYVMKHAAGPKGTGIDISKGAGRGFGDVKTGEVDQLLDDVRKRLALQYLTTTHLPLYEIALLLGFNDPSNFRRAFRKWTGKLPSDYREAP